MEFIDLGELISESKFFKDDSNLLKLTLAICYLATQFAGLVIILLLSGYILYTKIVPPPIVNQSSSVSESQNLPQQIVPTDNAPVILDTAEAPQAQETAAAIPQADTTEAAAVDPVTGGATAIAEPQLTPTTVVASISMINGDICAPISGVDISELSSIISQPYNVPNPYSDYGHHGVDWGSYNYHGDNLLGYPIQAVFPGRVAGITNNRPPIGNTLIIETTYEKLPERLRTLLNIQPGQSLYHMYSHMVNPPDFVIGDEVTCGQMVGNLGQSQTAEAHLHFETRIGVSGYNVGSMAFYDTSATEAESTTYMWWRTSGDLMPFDPMSLFANLY